MTENDMKITLCISEDYVDYMREKFDIENEDDLISAVWECISTYMEL